MLKFFFSSYAASYKNIALEGKTISTTAYIVP